VNVQCENDNTEEDGDPGEIVIGIMVDALPPFDGQTLPPTDYYLKLICVDFQIAPDAPCNQCSPISFCCANGKGTVPVRNLASIDYQAVEPILVNGEVCILAEPTFIRGDCNFSGKLTGACGPQAVDISDAAAVIGYLFMTGSWQFHPLCLDACDANDDGRIDLADSVYILRYLFKFDREPKAPFPDPGEDPTPDRLTCEGGSVCL
jgi:hypothetical protein